MSHVCFNAGRSGSAALHDYDYLRATTRAGWAWEYLRRNFDYQASARLGRRKGVVRSVLPPVRSSPACGPGISAPRRGHSPAFVDPRLTAKEGHPVWLPESGAAALHLDAVCLDAPTAAIPNVEHILLDPVGRQHVVLRTGSTSLQLTINGQACIISPTTPALHLRSRHDIRTAKDALTELEAVISASESLASAPPLWTAEPRGSVTR